MKNSVSVILSVVVSAFSILLFNNAAEAATYHLDCQAIVRIGDKVESTNVKGDVTVDQPTAPLKMTLHFGTSDYLANIEIDFKDVEGFGSWGVAFVRSESNDVLSSSSGKFSVNEPSEIQYDAVIGESDHLLLHCGIEKK